MRGTGILGMYCVLVREGPRLSHRFKLKVTFSLFVQERLGQRGCVQWRRRGVCLSVCIKYMQQLL